MKNILVFLCNESKYLSEWCTFLHYFLRFWISRCSTGIKIEYVVFIPTTKPFWFWRLWLKLFNSIYVSQLQVAAENIDELISAVGDSLQVWRGRKWTTLLLPFKNLWNLAFCVCPHVMNQKMDRAGQLFFSIDLSGELKDKL